MIRKWLVRRAEIERLAARLDALAGEVTPPHVIDRLDARVAAIERDATPPPAILRLEERIAAVERDLETIRSWSTGLGGDLRRLEQQATATALGIARAGRRVEALRRLVRAGGSRLQRLVAGARGAETAARSHEADLARIAARFQILDQRIESEAEQARRAATGLFERIEELRREVSTASAPAGEVQED